MVLPAGATAVVPLRCGEHVEMELRLAPVQGEAADTGEHLLGAGGGGDVASACAGVLFHNWRGGAEGAAALLYHWASGVLEVVFEAMDPATLTFSLAAPGARRVGGRLLRPPPPSAPLSLRLFLDYSCLEVFTEQGEVLTTRLYRGSPPAVNLGASPAGIELISVDGPTRVLHAAAYEMRSAFAPSDISDAEAAGAAVPLKLQLLADCRSEAPGGPIDVGA